MVRAQRIVLTGLTLYSMKISRSCVRIRGAENLLIVVSRSQNEHPDPETGTSGV